MQTKRKRKQWVLIALTMIATLTLQLFAPVTAHAEEISTDERRTITIPIKYTYQGLNSEVVTMIDEENVVVGSGVFVTRSFYKCYKEDDTASFMYSYIFSDMSFTVNDVLSTSYNGVYYCTLESSYGGGIYTPISVPNLTTGENDETSAPRYLIDNGVIDLTKDDYKELVFDESTATYDANLDFASLGAKSNSAWTVSKGDDGYTLTTPSTAGVNIYWKNKQYVENSYVKIYFNGKYYKKFLDIKYVDGAISLSGEGSSSSVEYDKIDRSSNSVFFLYNDILSECIKQNNYDGGYSFVIDNIQLQCYAEIDGIVKKSRIYKIDFNLLRENGTTDTVFNDASNVTYSTTDSVLGDFTTAYDDLEFVADIDVDKPIYEYDEVETNSFIKFFKWFYEMLQGITNSLGQFPQLLTSVFGFLPKEVTIIIGLALGAVVILRFLGR